MYTHTYNHIMTTALCPEHCLSHTCSVSMSGHASCTNIHGRLIYTVRPSACSCELSATTSSSCADELFAACADHFQSRGRTRPVAPHGRIRLLASWSILLPWCPVAVRLPFKTKPCRPSGVLCARLVKLNRFVTNCVRRTTLGRLRRDTVPGLRADHQGLCVDDISHG